MDSNCNIPLKLRINVFPILAIQVHLICSIILMSFVLLYLLSFNQVDFLSTACTGEEVLTISDIYRSCEFGSKGNPRWEQGIWQH